jgi:hypothetical protein
LKIIRNLAFCALWCAASAGAQQTAPAGAPPKPAGAQDTAPPPSAPAKPANATAQSEAGEPRANTSEPRTAEPRPAELRPGAGTPSAARTAPAAGQKSPNAIDKLQLGTATVTGDREQPKVMYVVPWKKADIGDLEGKPMNSLVDEILSPVDRDVFKREVRYYQTVKSEASQNGAPPPAGQGEK